MLLLLWGMNDPPSPYSHRYKLAGDLNDDCLVNFWDFCLMMENWLTDCRVQPTDSACVPK